MYVVGEQILLKIDYNTKFGKNPFEGPYAIVRVVNTPLRGTGRSKEEDK